ncbi:divergent paired-related homeobox [Tenrec ecaudatus]|uniref:divergent paired-related homeobox n=1 Tax=Tenrec ecaudatus TaxID=94439 RepID=UPI003F5A5887
MADPKHHPNNNHWQCTERNRTKFTEGQLKELKCLFLENPYPSSTLLKQVASNMGLDPTVLKVWFKNYRARLRKAKDNAVEPKRQEAQYQQIHDHRALKSPERTCCTHLGSPNGAHPAPLVYTGHLVPSFQLRKCPDFKPFTDDSLGHNIIHFGCCQDSNIYYLDPIWNPEDLSPNSDCTSLIPGGLQTKDRTWLKTE